MALDAQIERSQHILDTTRRQHPERVGMAMAVLDKIDGIAHKTLWMYYVMAYSNTEISKELKYDVREVMRRKAEGLKILEVLDGVSVPDGDQ